MKNPSPGELARFIAGTYTRLEITIRQKNNYKNANSE